MSRPVALVTGASRGIGRAIAVSFARGGYDVAITARTVHEGDGRVKARTGSDLLPVPGSLESARAELEQFGGRVATIQMDLLDLEQVRAVPQAVVAELGHIDVCVNNAYAQTEGNMDRLLNIKLTDAEQMWRGNFLHQLALIQQTIPLMLATGGGSFVNVVSGSAYLEPPAAPGEGGWGLSYASSKAAFGRLTGMINAEYRASGVRAFSVDPGFVITESGRARGGTENIAKFQSTVLPETVAQVAYWLVTHPDAEKYVNQRVRVEKLLNEPGVALPDAT